MKTFTAISAMALLLSASAAGAADLTTGSLKDGAAVSPSVWTGFYLGVQGGYGWDSNVVLTDPIGPTVTAINTGVRPAGWFGGLSADALWQASGIVYGIGTDINVANIADNSAVAGQSGLNSTIDWFGTLHARAGLPVGPALLYGVGGLAYGGVSTRAVTGNTALSGDTTRVGWMAGAGGEFKFTPGWSLHLEWNHIDLGASSVSEIIQGLGTATVAQQNQFEIVKIGLNYKLGADLPGALK
jgi:outer membrane immunogenic protein